MRLIATPLVLLWSSGILAQTIASPESFLIEAAKQVPALLVLAWIVYSNNKDRRDSEKQRAELEASRDQNLMRLGDACHLFQSQLSTRVENALMKVSEAINRSNEVLGHSAGALQHHSVSLQRLDEALEKLDAALTKQRRGT